MCHLLNSTVKKTGMTIVFKIYHILSVCSICIFSASGYNFLTLYWAEYTLVGTYIKLNLLTSINNVEVVSVIVIHNP